MTRALFLCAVLLGALPAVANTIVLSPDQRAERDASRLRDAQSNSEINTRELDDAAARRTRLTRSLEATQVRQREMAAANDELTRADRALGEDLALVDAIARSTLQAQNRRLRLGPVGVDRPQMIDDGERALREPPGLQMLYDSWFSLHTEWLASGETSTRDTPVTRRDGERRDARVTRYGAVGIAYERQLLEIDPNAGLLQSPSQNTSLRVDREFLLQQVYDSGVIGVAVLLCALAGVIVALGQLRRRAPRNEPTPPQRARRQTLKLIASAAMLLGLLGTVVGLIHTFRALAHFGGADASIAAAGISHALSTTWMGLSVAIPLILIQAALNGLPLRAGRVGAIELPRRAANTPKQRRAWPRLAPALLGAIALTVVLFFFMQWLTQRPLVEPVAAPPPLRVTRIDWSTPPPPPPPQQQPISLTAPATATGSRLSELPPLAALPAPSTDVALPGFAFDTDLAGLRAGSGALSGAGQMWTGATGGDAFQGGRDLVPISSARPRYPRAALDAAVEGWVEAIFIIDADGSVRDVRIIDADPPGVFEQAAATALERWLYAPFYRDGKPVAREATQLLRFSLDDARDTYLRDED